MCPPSANGLPVKTSVSGSAFCCRTVARVLHLLQQVQHQLRQIADLPAGRIDNRIFGRTQYADDLDFLGVFQNLLQVGFVFALIDPLTILLLVIIRI